MKKLIVLAGFIPTITFAQGTMTPEMLWKLGRVSGGSVSPDGKNIVYGVTNYSLEANKGNRDLFVIPVAGGEAKKITSFEGSEFNEVWTKNNTIQFLSSKSGSVQIWEVKTDGTEPVKVTEVENGMNSFLLSKDNSSIVYTQDVKLDQSTQDLYPDLPKANAFITDDLMYRHWDSWHDYSYSHVFHLKNSTDKSGNDLMKDQRYDSPLNPFGGIEQIAVSNDGKWIVYTSKKKNGSEAAISTNSDLYLVDLSLATTSNLTEKNVGYDVNPAFSPDGKFLAYQSMKTDGFEADKNDIILRELATGNLTNLTKDFDQTTGSFVWGKDGKNIYVICPYFGTEQIFELNLATKKLRRVTTAEHDYVSVEVFGNFIIAGKQHMNSPTELFKIDIKTGKETQLTFTNKAIYDNIKLGKVEKRWIKSSDGKEVMTWVIYPPDFDPNKKYPALLYCQGGPQSTVSQFFSYRWNFQLMAAKGYIVVAPNRRGLPSFGQAWNDTISKNWGGQAIDDYLSAVDSVAKLPFVDKNRLGAVGASYGGYSVYFIAGKHKKRFKAFVSHCGLFNIESFYGTTEEVFFAKWDIGGAYWEKRRPRSYDEFSPHKFVQNWDTPILVIHGQKDFRVPYNQGMEAFQAARLQGIPARFLLFPNENHWVLSPQNAIVWQREFFGWLDKYLK